MPSLPFLNRHSEIRRLERGLNSEEPVLMIISGRRRCGKSRLLRQVARPGDVYHLADQQERPLQIQSLASSVGRVFPGFEQGSYASWDQLFLALAPRITESCAIFLDEFPYLVQQDPALLSVLQRYIDMKEMPFHWVLSGSSQRMMQGIVIDSQNPLYGRALEILQIRPLAIRWMPEVFEWKPEQVVEEYAIWGGVPRYWELRHGYESLEDAALDLIFDSNGILHLEPHRLLRDNMKQTVQAHSILAAVGTGHHRISKVASRLEKPVNSLTRPLGNLVDLGYLHKEVPFGESPENSKQTLYRLSDPFLEFWYRFVHQRQALLQQHLGSALWKGQQQAFLQHISWVWEQLARESVASLKIDNIDWMPAQRWWGKGKQRAIEVDVVAESFDQQHLLLGEVKWESSSSPKRLLQRLKSLVSELPFTEGKQIHFACWLKFPEDSKEITVITPQDLLRKPQ